MADKLNNKGRNKKFETLVINEARYKTLLSKKFKNRKKYVEPDARKVMTSLPGTVVEIFVKEGQAVHKGDDLVILEAMKMNTRIKASVSGIIKLIKIKKGENLPKGKLIIEIE